MNHFELHAHMKVRPGKLEGFKAQAAELIRITREQDTKTLRYDWFLKEDGTECEVHELYLTEAGLFEHNQHVMAAREILFRDFAFDHKMAAFGEVSPSWPRESPGSSHVKGSAPSDRYAAWPFGSPHRSP